MLDTILKAVFDVQPSSKYGDDISRRYQFRARRDYLDVAHACIDDWIIFRETGSGGGRYASVARVDAVKKDLLAIGFCYVEIADYLPFTKPATIKFEGEYLEAGARAVPRSVQIGQLFQSSSMRDISDDDFDRIVCLGFQHDPLLDVGADAVSRPGLEEPGQPGLAAPKMRPIERVLASRLFRDRMFRDHVGKAYDFRCAFSLNPDPIPDGFGHVEGQAAHLQSVADLGPDIVYNGLYASGTPHWIFDRHVMSINPDYTLIIAPGLLSPITTAQLLPSGSRIRLPSDPQLWPYAEYMEIHRAEFRRKRGL